MVNKMVLQGRLTKDVELRRTQSGTAVAGFTVAWSEKYGENEQKLFMPCVAWKGTAEMASRYFSKGQELAVEGKLITRKWQDRDGNNRETIELIVERMHFCGAKRDDDKPNGGFKPAGNPVNAYPSDQEWAEMGEEDGPLPF